jgi:ferredoxin
MMHQLSIDATACRGLDLCHACTAIKPGLVDYCAKHGRLLLSHEHTARIQPLLSRLVAVCPAQAIMIKPLMEQKTP